jgi:Cu-Zn family superoxide dismutase
MLQHNLISNRRFVCVLQSRSNPQIRGEVYFEYKNNKVHISGFVEGLKPGKHGFHIHEKGDLTKGCDSLCSHYNPFNKTHGDLNNKNSHVGDLGNIIANINGYATINILSNYLKLDGEYSILGRSVIVHEGEDDLGLGNNPESLKTGNAGSRVACGVIGIA